MYSQLLLKTTSTRIPDPPPTASSHYHGNSQTVMQFPKADIPGDNLVIHPIHREDGYDLTPISSSYSIVVQVYHYKEPLHPQVLTFQGTVDGSAGF